MTTSEPSLSDVALMTCPACGHRVSHRAAACPRCGDPINAEVQREQVKSKPPQRAGNVIAALASFLVPGLGQLAQGRPLVGLLFFLCTIVGWALWLGWLFHIGAAIEAAVWNGED